MGKYRDMMEDWFERIWNKGDTSALDEYFAADGVIDGIDENPIVGPDEFRAFHAKLNAGLADMKITVKDMLEDGEKVCGHFVVEGVHRNTGKEVEFTSHFFGTVKDGKIIHAANDVDYLGLMIQVGAVPADVMEKAMAPK